MPHVAFTRHLQRYFPTLNESEEVPGATVRELLDELERRHPGFSGYIVDKVGPGDKVHILQALSGG